jgi:lipopolysaccharide export system protein LptC
VSTICLANAERRAAFPASSRGDIEQTYRRALRHSRRVRLLRVSVIAGIAMVLLAVVAANYMPPIGGFRLPGEMGKLVIKGTKITMQAPRLSGFTNDSRAYEFTAKAAAQDITKPNFVELQEIRAKMEMADKSMVDLTADTGVYNLKTDMLTLSNNIHVVSSTGYQGRLSRAVVDVRKGNVVSDQPVWVNLLDGFLNAKRMEIVDNGDVIRFGKVTMILQPSKEATKEGEP